MTATQSSAPREAYVPLGNGLTLACETRGPADGSPIVLIMGLGTQLLGWPESFCDALAAAGLRVIRFDNRDIGLSTKFEGARPRDDVRAAFAKSLLGLPIRAPYRLDDMAEDTVALLDGLGIERAHLVGASMGGMIAQIAAARYPDRILSLTSIMSSSGARGLPSGHWRILLRLSSRPKSSDTESLVAHLTTTMRMIGSPGLQHSREDWAELIRAGITRSYYPAGTSRQMLAILASGSRERLLRDIRCPSLVIHGDADRLVPVAHGRHTASCIPDARLEIVSGMAHDLPPSLQHRLATMIAAHADATEADARAAPGI